MQRSTKVLEGHWPGHVVMIGFPDAEAASDWWRSRAYRAIAPLRSSHIEGDIILVAGVSRGYDTTAAAAAVRAVVG